MKDEHEEEKGISNNEVSVQSPITQSSLFWAVLWGEDILLYGVKARMTNEGGVR
jgi:hypothetical protein